MKKKNLTSFEIVSLLSVIGMISWYITDYFGGMILHVFMYWYLIIPVLIIYLISLLRFIFKILKTGFRKNKVITLIHSLFLIFLLLTFVFESDLFKSKRVLTGILKDDLSHQTLIFRENGSCENDIVGFLGFKESFYGKYFMKGDTIIFTKKPYNNDFLPDTIFLNRNEKAIFLYKNTYKKEWLNHFELQ